MAAFNRLDVNNDNILSRDEMINADVDDTTVPGTSAQVRAPRLQQPGREHERPS